MNSLALRQYPLSLRQIATALPNEFASFDLCIDDNLITVTGYIFLHDDGIRSGRHWRAGKDSNRFTGRNAELPVRTGRLFADDTQSFAFSARTRHDRVAVHR